MSASHTSPSSLSEQLQEVTEALAAAQTTEAVFRVVLQTALKALRAFAGAVLLVDAAGEWLNLAARQGDTQVQPSLWQDEPLDAPVPAADALRQHGPLLFERPGDLVRAYPDVEVRTGGVATAATAVLPMFLDARPLGVLILDFKEPHAFPPEEVRFLRTLAAQSALALGRASLLADLHRQVEDRTWHLLATARAQDAFVAFTEAAASETDLRRLASQAITVLRGRFPYAGIGFYSSDGDLWKAQVWSDDMDADLVRDITAGLPRRTPLIRRTLEAGAAVFTEAWNPEQEEIAHSEAYGAGAAYPLLIGGDIHYLLLVGLRDTREWSGQDQALVRAVGRGLNLVIERAEQSRRLAEQNAELEARTKALEGLARLSQNLALHTDRYDLIRRAQELVLPLLPPGYAAYFEPQEGRWQVRSQVADAGSPLLQAAIEAGFPVGQTPTLDIGAQTGAPYFVDAYAHDTDGLPEIAGHLNAAACLPILVKGEVIGIFNVPLFGTTRWTAANKALLITTARSLSLAIEGAQGVEALAERTAEVERANAELALANEEMEAFSYSASHDLRTPVRHVKGFVEMTLRDLQPEANARAVRYLGLVSEAADRMNAMIDALLALSQVGRAELKMRPVALLALVQQAQQDVRLEFPELAVEWQVGELPTALADPVLLQQVFTNLLSNAVKYRKRGEVPTVRIWTEDRRQEVVLFVQDNGVGFDSRYADKLFGAFQRLHAQREFTGTGIGLATVRRIVNRHGGQVWAQSRLGEGATFGFSLPRREARIRADPHALR